MITKRLGVLGALLVGITIPFMLAGGPTPQPPRPIRLEAVAPMALTYDGGAYGLAVRDEISGQTITDAGFSLPYSTTLNVYVMSEIHVQLATPQPTLGSDDNDCLTKATPCLTLDGVRRQVGRHATAGKRIVVHLAGGGWPGVADPWDGQPTSPRYYLTRDLFVGGGEAFANGWSFRGPRKMLVRGGPITVTNFGGDGLRTKWDTTGTGGSGDDLKGSFVRVLRGAREVTQPMQITNNNASSFWTDNGPNTPGSVYMTSDTYYFVDPAAEIVPTNDLPGDVGGADGVATSGAGGADVHGRPSNGLNPGFTFERIAIENFRSNNVPGLSFDVVRFYGSTPVTFRGGWVEFHNCIVLSQAGVDMLAGSRVVGSTSENNEYNGRALVVDTDNPPPSSPTADPIWPARGGIGLYVTPGATPAGAGMRVGDARQSATYRIWRSLTVEGELTIRGKGSALYQPANLNLLFIRNPGGVGLRVLDGAEAQIDAANGLVEITAVSQLKVGIGAAISLGTGAGQFNEVAGWNGNFSRHLETNGAGRPTGDFSRISDSSIWFTQ